MTKYLVIYNMVPEELKFYLLEADENTAKLLEANHQLYCNGDDWVVEMDQLQALLANLTPIDMSEVASINSPVKLVECGFIL